MPAKKDQSNQKKLADENMPKPKSTPQARGSTQNDSNKSLESSVSPSATLEELGKRVEEVASDLNDKLVDIQSKQLTAQDVLQFKFDEFKREFLSLACSSDVRLVVRDLEEHSLKLSKLDTRIEKIVDANKYSLSQALERAQELRSKMEKGAAKADKELKRLDYIRIEKAILKTKTRETRQQITEISKQEKKLRGEEAQRAEREKQARAAATKAQVQHLKIVKAKQQAEINSLKRQKQAEQKSLNLYRRVQAPLPSAKRLAIKEVGHVIQSGEPEEDPSVRDWSPEREPPKKKMMLKEEIRDDKAIQFVGEEGVAYAVQVEGKTMASTVVIPKKEKKHN